MVLIGQIAFRLLVFSMAYYGRCRCEQRLGILTECGGSRTAVVSAAPSAQIGLNSWSQLHGESNWFRTLPSLYLLRVMKKDDMTKRRKKTKSKTMTMINTFREHLQNFKTFREQPQMAILEKLWNCWHFWQWTAFAILAMFTLGMLVRESDELKTSASWIELKLSTRVWWLKTSSIKEIYQV